MARAYGCRPSTVANDWSAFDLRIALTAAQDKPETGNRKGFPATAEEWAMALGVEVNYGNGGGGPAREHNNQCPGPNPAGND